MSFYDLRSGLFRGAVVLSMLSAAACSSYAEEEQGDEGDGLGAAAAMLNLKDANTLMEDSDFEGDQDITVADVQAVLDLKKSPLATYKVGTRTAAQIIVEESIAQRISPVFMVARIQTEQALITSRTNIDNLESATGCGCHDAKKCAAVYKGFDKQVKCTATKFREYFDNLRQGLAPAGGVKPNANDTNVYMIGRKTLTEDPLRSGRKGCSVTPTNAATAAVLTYTPYVGVNVTNACPSTQVGGAGLQIRVLENVREWMGR